MALDLTLTSAGYNGTGKYGASLNAGYGLAATALTGGTITISAWVKTSTNGVHVCCGQGGAVWMGADASGNATAHYGLVPDVAITTSVSIKDNVWHHLELDVTPASTGGKFYVDGVLAGSSATTATMDLTTNSFCVRAFAFASNTIGFTWQGDVDEVAVYTTIQHTTNFTPGPVGNNDAGLRAIWHLDNDGVNSQGVSQAATGVTMTGPASGTTGSASTNFTLGVTPVGGTITGTVVVTPSDAADGGTFTGTTVSLTTGSPTGTFTYTGATDGVKTISVTNDGGLTNPSNITYTSGSGATVPGAPTIGTASAGNTTASVPFTAPGSNGGATITSYTATSTPGGITGTLSQAGSGTISVTGLTNGTAYTFTVHATNSAGNSAESAASNSVTPVANNALVAANVLFSPGNWNLIANTAKTINAGAYFKTVFGGTTCSLTFDLTGVTAPLTKLAYRVDQFGPWTFVDLAASITVAIPSETAAYTSHLLEVYVRSTSEAINRWSPQATAVFLTAIILDATKVLVKPPALPTSILIIGDSITDGINAVTNVGDATLRGSALQGYAFVLGQLLSAEVGVVGFGGQGWIATGSGGVPIVGSTYNFHYSGAARSFTSPVFDAIVINQGQNDAASNTVANCTAVLNGLIAATTKVTKIIVLRPFSGNQAANLQSAIAACTDPTRCVYINTTGFFTTANSADTVHPYGWEHITHIAPLVANAIRPYIQPLKGTRTARTVTVTFENRSGTLQANLTGLKWAWFDQATPDVLAVPADSGTGATTNGSGVFTITVYTTLASAATGWLEVGNSDGTAAQAGQIAFSGPVVVS